MNLDYFLNNDDEQQDDSNVDKTYILSSRDHVRKRPNTYIGSVNMEEHHRFIKGKYIGIEYVEGLVKIIDEVIDNSVDEAIRTNFEYANRIEIEISNTQVKVSDNGRGIPHDDVREPETGRIVPKPVASWTIKQAGSNFDDTNRITMGMNGMGGSITNFCSAIFVGETSNGVDKMIVNSIDGAKTTDYRVIKSSKSEQGTTVKFVPDFSLFGVTGIDENTISIIEDRIQSLAVAFPAITFTINKEKISNNFKRYAELYSNDKETFTESSNKINLILMNSDIFAQKSFVNGLDTKEGGTHVDTIINGISDELIPLIKKSYKIDITKARIKENLALVLFIHKLNAPSFASQTKTRLSNTVTQINEHVNLNYKKIAKKLLDIPDIITPIIESALAKKADEDSKFIKNAKKKVDDNIAKHCEANGLDDPNIETTLFITEGDSAIGQIVQCRDDMTQGAFPLRGRVKTTWGLSNAEVMKNKELSELLSILNLSITSKSIENMTYDNIGIMVDADVDGTGAILPSLLSFFARWTDLFEQNRIRFIRTPIVIATKDNKEKWYYEMNEEYEKDRPSLKNIRYLKGLGSLREGENGDYAKVMSSHMKYEIIKLSKDYKQIFDVVYGDVKTFGADRKQWIDGSHEICKFIDNRNGDNQRSLNSVIMNEARTFSLYTISHRAIPNLIDGFKPSQRFFVYSASKQSGMSKVASISGRVSDFGYHHGEESISKAGQLMSADWANNLPLFNRDGFFGSRMVQSPSAPRYVKCELSKVFDTIYLDNDILESNSDPEVSIPKNYLPILPMVLINGAVGIAVGYATNIPPHSPTSVLKSVRNVLNGKECELIYKHPRFNGTYDNNMMYGCYELSGKTKLTITEIPYMYDREKYKAILSKLKKDKVIVSFEDKTKQEFRYNIVLKRDYTDGLDKDQIHDKIIKDFRLYESINPNYNIFIDELVKFDSADDMLKRFVDIRLKYYTKRIANKLRLLDIELSRIIAKLKFIDLHDNGDIVLSNQTKDMIRAQIDKYDIKEHADMLLSMNIYHLSDDEYNKLLNDKQNVLDDIVYWKAVTEKELYLSDLDNVEKVFKKMKLD